MTPKSCAHCRRVFAARYAAKKFCSKACMGLAWRRPERVCRWCHKSYASAGAKYCSTVCRNAGSRKRRMRPCAECLTEFHPRADRSRFCSQSCATRRMHREHPEIRARVVTKLHEYRKQRRLERDLALLKGCQTKLDAFRLGRKLGWMDGWNARGKGRGANARSRALGESDATQRRSA